MRNIVTPCGEGRVTTRSCEGLVQAGSTFPGRKRIVKSNTESNRVESEGPESAVLHIVAHGRVVRKWRAWQRENAGCWPLHLAYMYVLCQRAFCIRAVATSSSSFSLAASFPANFSFRPPFLHDVHTASFLLIKSRPPRLSRLSSFLSFLRFHPRFANRKTATVSMNSEKRMLAPKKRKARYNIASVCLIDRLFR